MLAWNDAFMPLARSPGSPVKEEKEKKQEKDGSGTELEDVCTVYV